MRKFLIILILGIFLPNFVLADGGIFPPPYYPVYETGQKAVIFYEKGQETLILSTTFKGEAKDFGWVIPTPSKPQVEKGSDEIFTSLAEITRPVYRDYYAPLGAGFGAKEAAQTVTVIETKKIDYYEIAVLSATDSQALAKWLEEHDYQYPQNKAYILNDYINNNWYFVAVKISPEAQGDQDVAKGLEEGHATPLKLVFQAERPIYPLKISSIEPELTIKFSEPYVEIEGQSEIINRRIPPSYRQDYVGINLYVIATHKKEIPGFSTQYGNWIKAKTIKELAFDVNGKPLIEPQGGKFFLTHLYRSMQPQEMKEDLFLRDTPDNKKVNAGPSNWNKFWKGLLAFVITVLVWIFSPVGLLFIIFSLVQFLSKSRRAHRVSFIFQVLCLTLVVVGGIVFYLYFDYLSFVPSHPEFFDYQVYGFLIGTIVVLTSMITTLILQDRFHKKQRLAQENITPQPKSKV